MEDATRECEEHLRQCLTLNVASSTVPLQIGKIRLLKAHRQVLERCLAVDRERGKFEIEMQQHGGSMNRMLLQTKLSLEQGREI
jgi:hypothetical protein